MDFQPAIYEHAARLIGARPWDVSRNADLLFQAHSAAYEVYRHSPVIVGIDVYNVEPEAHGAVLAEPEGNGVPTIASHPYTRLRELTSLPVLDPRDDGRLAMVIEVGRRLKAKYPAADVRIPVSGPFSLACNLIGFETLLCETFDNPDLAGLALDHIVSCQISFCRTIAAAGLKITMFDSGTTPPLVSPAMFEEVVFPPLERMIRSASFAQGQMVSCIIGGNTEPIIGQLMKTKPGFVICPSETNQAEFLRKMEAYPATMVRVNMNPGVFATNNMAIIEEEANRVFEIARHRLNACVGTGVLPYEADPALVTEIAEHVMIRSILLT